MLYKRYSDPLPLLDQMAATGHLAWWVVNFINTTTEEENERFIFETWLHKEWKHDLATYRKEIMDKVSLVERNKAIRNNPNFAARTVEKSFAIMNSFGKPTDL